MLQLYLLICLRIDFCVRTFRVLHCNWLLTEVLTINHTYVDTLVHQTIIIKYTLNEICFQELALTGKHTLLTCGHSAQVQSPA